MEEMDTFWTFPSIAGRDVSHVEEREGQGRHGGGRPPTSRHVVTDQGSTGSWRWSMRDIRLARALAQADTYEEPRQKWLVSGLLVLLIALLTFAVSAMRAESALADDADA